MNFDFQQLKQLNALDFEDIAIWPKEIKIFVCLLTALGVLGLSFYLVIQPKLPLLDEAAAQEQALKNQYQAKYRIAVNLAAYEAQLKQIEADFSTMLKALPTSNETPGLLDDITYVGTTSGLGFKLLNWQPELIKEFYTELPIQIEVSGKYHDFGAFVTKIASLPRIVTLHDFILRQETDGLYLQLQAKTYRAVTQIEAQEPL
ncbi:type 4a pilus biogenesis protein PilO [Opacimonas viscosa]|uniref:Type 4a pilus biogenesis protein PilO n=1 Tax=Opacimonas viscosa TaxID=2961944 RepID=A0AA41X4D1_9ALTE|nr:type 4a pilus biogenesis protein PilO [Opacimonas viscosa]MCP3429261.1 type 4a pilus biogenesis protein PilO [Opacimonas viscosa]